MTHELGQRVSIVALNESAIIEQILHSFAGTQYSVAYWFNGDRKTAWVQSSEITTGVARG